MTDQLSVIVAGLSVIALKRLKRLLRVWGLEENEDYGEEKMDVMMVTARAPVNIAIIKYWGKRNEDLVLPLNDSLSVTLSKEQMYAETTVAVSASFSRDRMWLNGKEQDMENPRLQNCLREIRRRARKRKTYDDESKDEHYLNFHVHICSCNNFPTAAGLASSAAGYACLVYALGKLFKVEADLSEIARQGSGSACRSIYGGFVQWIKGTEDDGSDSVAKQIASNEHWPELRIFVLVVSDQKKHTSSTQGMGNSVTTSDLLKYRAAHIVPHRIKEITNAILEKNFQKFAEITMKDSNQCHAICMDTYPPLHYMNATSMAIMNLVHSYNAFYGVNKIAYTFDAGPNACLFMLERSISDVAALIKHFFPSNVDNSKFFIGLPVMPLEHLPETLINSMQVSPIHRGLQYVIHTQVGTGPELIEISSAHLLDDAGIPKQSTS